MVIKWQEKLMLLFKEVSACSSVKVGTLAF